MERVMADERRKAERAARVERKVMGRDLKRLEYQVNQGWQEEVGELKNEIKQLEILVPNDKLVARLKQHYIPKLIEICEFEQSFETDNSLKQLFTMLFRYDELTFNLKKKDINDPKIISMLPIVVSIS